MVVSWSADMDQRLLMAVLAVVKVDTAAVEEQWKELFKSENITQPTKRAIVEHIAKLKKSLGISGGKSHAGNGLTNPVKPKAKGKAAQKPKSPRSVKTEDRDDTESPVGIKDERIDSPMRESDSSAQSPKSKGKPQAKRRRGSISDEESSGDEIDVAIKSEDDEFRGPRSDKGIPSPTRSQAPRRAKSERKVSWVELSSTEEDDFSEDEDKDGKDDETMNEGSEADDTTKDLAIEQGEDVAGDEKALLDSQLVHGNAEVMVIG